MVSKYRLYQVASLSRCLCVWAFAVMRKDLQGFIRRSEERTVDARFPQNATVSF